jgi:Zn-dependent peptidase ImmA (M78 family)/DNA-binding XRE family transcriptional regulator
MENKMVNYRMVTLARESRGLSQKELSELLEIKQGTLSKIENGLQGVSDELKIKLSEVLAYPFSFFEQEEHAEDFSLYHYRRKLKLPKKELEICEAQMKIVVLNIAKLLTNVNLPESNLPLDLDKTDSPEECANILREIWGIPPGRIDDLTKVLEDHGFLIVNMDFETKGIDGIGILTEKNNAIIFMDKSLPSDRYRLSLPHEVFHILKHVRKSISADRDVEKEAFLFAGALLMPEKEIKKDLEKLTLEKLADLKRYWKVSMGAIIMRAKALGCLSQDQYEYLWRKMNKEGYKKKEPTELDFPKEQPMLLKEIIDTYLNDPELHYSEQELAAFLNLQPDEFYLKYLISPSYGRLKVNRGGAKS